MKRSNKSSLSSLLQKAIGDSDGESLQVGDVVDRLGYRGFGPLLIIPAVIVISPLGAVPGVPAVVGLVIVSCSLQVMFGMDKPWLPQGIRKLSLRRKKVKKAIDKKKAVIKKVDGAMSRRMQVLTGKPIQRLTGAVTFCLSLCIIFIGFIPFAPDALAVPILLFGLGYIAQDGLFVLLGYLLMLGAVFIIPLLQG